MRTFIQSKLKWVLKWLKLWMITNYSILTARAAICLKLDFVTICRLTDTYHLPFYKTKKQNLYFKKKSIDAWLRLRRRRDLPSALREIKKQSTHVQND